MRKGKRRGGFTLIELIIAVTISLVIIAVIDNIAICNSKIFNNVSIKSNLQTESQNISEKLTPDFMHACRIRKVILYDNTVLYDINDPDKEITYTDVDFENLSDGIKNVSYTGWMKIKEIDFTIRDYKDFYKKTGENFEKINAIVNSDCSVLVDKDGLKFNDNNDYSNLSEFENETEPDLYNEHKKEIEFDKKGDKIVFKNESKKEELLSKNTKDLYIKPGNAQIEEGKAIEGKNKISESESIKIMAGLYLKGGTNQYKDTAFSTPIDVTFRN